MHQVQIKVRSKGKILQEPMVDQFDNLAEALEKEGEVACLLFVNNGIKTRVMNSIRGETSGVKSKKLLRRLVMEKNLVSKKDIDAALKQNDGFEKLKDLLDSKFSELQKLMKDEDIPTESDVLEEELAEDK